MTHAKFVVDAFLGVDPRCVGWRREALVNTGHDSGGWLHFIDGAHARQPDIKLVFACIPEIVRVAAGRVVALGVPTGSAQVDVFITQAGCECPFAPFNAIVNIGRPCIGVLDAVAGITLQPDLVEYQLASQLLEIIIALQAVFFIFVVAQARLQTVHGCTAAERGIQCHLDSAGIIFAGIIS